MSLVQDNAYLDWASSEIPPISAQSESPASVGGSRGAKTPPAHAGSTDKFFISNTNLEQYKIM
jgi:hypothetical protein